MALKINHRLWGVVDVGYCKISHIELDPSQSSGRFRVDFFADRDARYSVESSPLHQWFPIQFNGEGDYIEQAYTKLKSLPEFIEAMDE